MPKTVLLTGATGFVGGATLRCLLARKHIVIAAMRHGSSLLQNEVSKIHVNSIDGTTSWENCIGDVDVVIHAAARVHVMNETEADPLAAFRRVNVEGTMNLARQAASGGVRRFVFISSIMVNGESTGLGRTYSPEDTPAPANPYGISKMEAEQLLRELAVETGMEVVIIRPVLVYGPGVKANFQSMMRWLDKGIPLPLGAIHNSRSLVALDNLVDLIVKSISHPAAANQTFLVSDGEDLSTTQLLRKVAFALGRTARLIPIPACVLRGIATVSGRKALSNRLCGSLRVDISKTRSLLGWAPPVSADDALKATAQYYQERKKQ
jgi:UDP-glucose 4-epimerase